MKIVDINGKERDAVKVTPDPDFPGFVRVYYDSGVRKHHEWYSLEEFLKFNPKLADLAKGVTKPPEETMGIVSDAGLDYFQDENAEFIPNIYVGLKAWISRGKGEGQVFEVKANTEDTVYILGEWEVKPDDSSQYVLASYVGAAKPLGNNLPMEDIKKLEKEAERLERRKRVIVID